MGPAVEAEAGAMAFAAPAGAEAAGAPASSAGRPRSGGRRRPGSVPAPSRRRSRTPSSPRSRGQSRGGTPPHGAPACNPLDVVFDLLRAAVARPGALVPRRSVELQANARGINSEMFQEALENWFSLNLLDWPGYGDEVGLTAEAWCTQTCHLAPGLPRGVLAATGPSSPARAVALLSLFDGLGTARLAIQDALDELGHPTALTFAGHAGLDAILASAVEEFSAAGARAGGWLPY